MTLATLALLALAAPAAHAQTPHRVAIGLAEQKASVFDDPFFQRLVIRHARLHVGWDVLHNPWERRRTDEWLRGAQGQAIQPLITFGSSRIDHRRIPSPKRFAQELRDIRERWPQVRRFAVWNEVNHAGEPTLRRPALVARWWKALRRACPSCTIMPGELLDTPNMIPWVRAFKRHAKAEAAVWGVHNYAEANRFQTKRMRQLLRTVRGKIWLTEVGGIVRRLDRTKPSEFPETPEHAAKVTRFIFEEVVPISSRIERVYVYNWNASTENDKWDSAILDEHGQPRPAWWELFDALAEARMAR